MISLHPNKLTRFRLPFLKIFLHTLEI